MKLNIVSLNEYCKFNEVFGNEAENMLADDRYNIIMAQESRKLNDIVFKNTYNEIKYRALFESTENALMHKYSVGIYAQEDIFRTYPDSVMDVMNIPTLSYDDYGKKFTVYKKGLVLHIPVGDTSVTIMSLHATPVYQHTVRELSCVIDELNKYSGYWMFISEYNREQTNSIIGKKSRSLMHFNAQRIGESTFYCISSPKMNEIMTVRPVHHCKGTKNDAACSIHIDIPTDDIIQQGG